MSLNYKDKYYKYKAKYYKIIGGSSSPNNIDTNTDRVPEWLLGCYTNPTWQ